MKYKNDFKFEEYRNILKIKPLINYLEHLRYDKTVIHKLFLKY